MVDTKDDPSAWDTAMRRAIEVAGRSHAPFGAVICPIDHPDQVLFEGANTTDHDPTGHAEVNALRAMAAAGSERVAGRLALITTAEPCPMCASAIWWAGIGVVVFGTSIERLMECGWRQIALPAREVLAHVSGKPAPLVVGPWRTEWTDPLYGSRSRNDETLVNPV